MEDSLADIRKANKAGGNYAGQFVVYDLPDRDCAAAASNGEYSLDKDGKNKYKAYIAKIKGILQDYSDTRIILVIGKTPCQSSIDPFSLTSLQSPILSLTWSPT